MTFLKIPFDFKIVQKKKGKKKNCYNFKIMLKKDKVGKYFMTFMKK